MRKDEWRLLEYGLLTAGLMALFLVPIFIYAPHFPKGLAEAILFVIAASVFLLSKYLEGRRKSKRSSH